MALFQSREIRRTLHNDEWWFVMTGIVAALTDAADAIPICPPLALAFDAARRRQKPELHIGITWC